MDRAARRATRRRRRPARGTPGGATAGVREHELGVGAAAYEAQQRFELVGLDARVAPHQAFVA
ncbi:MAG TPA: hypothetical protein VF923_00120, partial [Gemmatimonadales bacterium]